MKVQFNLNDDTLLLNGSILDTKYIKSLSDLKRAIKKIEHEAYKVYGRSSETLLLTGYKSFTIEIIENSEEIIENSDNLSIKII